MAAAVANPASPPDTNASGVFLNEAGDVLTARHAVSDCRTLFAVKGAQVAQATVIAASPELDLAVLRTTLKPYLSATLSRTDAAPGRSIGVFAEAYAVLQRLPDRAALLSNAMTVPGAEGLQLLSGVQPGASGSAVLGADGLLLGVVVERVAAAPHASGMTTLSRAASAAGVKGGATQVRAVPASQVRQFLDSHGIAFTESDSPQLSPMQSPAARASTLSVGVLCG
ncbi:S1 family peptidase [Variovorax sp. GB1P17]|uniref:S1 family peptidase n=1 Tax=Variovorax sp. GB1P17 TaxID=3443740 RepID=UPI003F4854C6